MLANLAEEPRIDAMNIQWHVGDVVRKMRESTLVRDRAGEHFMKQRELATKAGLRMATVSAVEQRGRYNQDTLEKIASALRTSVGDMYQIVQRCNSGEGSVCASGSAEHLLYQKLLERILHATDQVWGQAIIANLRAMAAMASPEPAPEGQDVGTGSQEILLPSGKRIRRGRR